MAVDLEAIRERNRGARTLIVPQPNGDQQVFWRGYDQQQFSRNGYGQMVADIDALIAEVELQTARADDHGRQLLLAQAEVERLSGHIAAIEADVAADMRRWRHASAAIDCPHCGEGMASHRIVTCMGGNEPEGL